MLASELSTPSPQIDSLFSKEGEMASLVRSLDWSKTPLGPAEKWSPALWTIVRFLLANRFPLLLWWGPQYVSIYNDAYIPILGTKHPWALSQPVRECWKEIWHILQPLIDTPFHGGPATWNDDLALEINRHGFVEETHFTIAYSPLPDDTVPSGIGGVLATVHEITGKVVGDRRVVVLRDLGARSAEAKTAEEACAIAAETLIAHAKDIPFALLYLIDADRQTARLAGTAGVAKGERASPAIVSLEGDETNNSPWPLVETMRREAMETVTDLSSRLAGQVPPGPWTDPPHTAVVVPIHSNKAHWLAGFLVAGISARLQLDDAYRDFLNLMSSQIATSIANAREYEEEKKRAEALAELDRAKTAFFSNVSHELRTPLTLLLGPLEDLLSGGAEELTESQNEQLELARRNALRLVKLVNTLLDFSRIEAGRVEAVYEPTDLAALTADLASVFRSAVERARLRLVVDCPPLTEPVYVDRDMWEKIVLNLLSNAVKFTFRGEITVSLLPRDQHVELQVCDTGTGIPAEELPHIFERFHRVRGATARTQEGTGIGLALVQELVKLHGGTLAATSTVGEGSCFSVVVPMGTAHLPLDHIDTTRRLTSTSIGAAPFVEEALRWLPGSEEEPVVDHSLLDLASLAAAPMGPGDRRASGSDTKHILVADDNADMRDYLKRLLSSQYRVETVSSGSAAFAAAQERVPDLVLADVMMPGLDGFELLHRLRANPRTQGVPIILLSARAGEESRVEGLEAGADDYLVKPFSARELLARVSSHLELARVREESNRRIANILESITDGFVALDTEWRYVYINRARSRTFALLAKSPDQLLGKTVWEESPELVGTLAEEQYRRAMREQKPISFEYYYPEIDTWFDIHAYPSPEGLSIYFQDVSERKRSELSVARLAAIVESSDDAVLSLDLDGIIQSWNSGAERMFGYAADEVTGKPVSVIYPPDHIDEFPRLVSRLRAGERIDHYETVRQRKDGALINVSVSVSPLRDADGKLIGASKISRDITERKRFDEVQTFLGEATEVLASSLDYETTLKSVARLAVPRLADWCVVDILDEEGKLRDLEIAHKEPEKVQWGWEIRRRYPLDADAPTGPGHVVRTGEPELFPEITDEMLAAAARTPEDLRLFRSIGLSSAMTIPLVARGRTLGTIELINTESRRRFGADDLTFAQELARRAALAVDNARLYREAQQAVRVREQFLSIASHELKTPLTSIYGYSQLLERLVEHGAAAPGEGNQVVIDRARVLANLQRLKRGSERLMWLISELLDLSRLQQGKLNLQLGRTDLGQLVSSLLETLREQQAMGLYPADLSLQLERPAGGTLYGNWDAARLEELILNLLQNALKYSLKGGTVSVSLTAEPDAAPAGDDTKVPFGHSWLAHIVVRDEGIGVPHDQQASIFQPFFRATNAGAKSFGGLGLGLAICKGIVEAHGGCIWVESAGADQGSSFHVILPGAEFEAERAGEQGLVLRADEQIHGR